MKGIIRTICYRAFCERCMEVVGPHPRLTKTMAKADLTDHNRAHHPRGKAS